MSAYTTLDDARRHDEYIETRVIHWHEASELVKVYGNECLHYHLTGAEFIKCVTYSETGSNRVNTSEFNVSELDCLDSHLQWVISRDDTYEINVESTYRLAVTATRDLWEDWGRRERPCLYWP